jgi:hypothetical protein
MAFPTPPTLLLGESRRAIREQKTIFINDKTVNRYDERIQKKPDQCLGSGAGGSHGCTRYNELSELDALRLASVKSKELRVKSMRMSIPKRREERATMTPDGYTLRMAPAFSGEGVKKLKIMHVKNRTPFKRSEAECVWAV